MRVCVLCVNCVCLCLYRRGPHLLLQARLGGGDVEGTVGHGADGGHHEEGGEGVENVHAGLVVVEVHRGVDEDLHFRVSRG